MFEFYSFNRFNKAEENEQLISSSNCETQPETIFSKKDSKYFQIFSLDLDKHKSKSYLKHQLNSIFNSLLTYYIEENKFYYQMVDNKIFNPRSPPV